MNPDQIEQLRALAEKATQPSPWEAVPDGDNGRFLVLDADGTWVADCGIDPIQSAFIAAFHPERVLALFAIIDKQQREIEHHKAEIVRLDTKLAEQRAKSSAFSAAHVVRSEMP